MTSKTIALLVCQVFLCAKVWAIGSQNIILFEELVFMPALNVAERYEDNFRVDINSEFSWALLFSPALSLKAYEYDRDRGEERLRAQCANSPGAIGCFWSL
jgi:predicted membrane protein